MSVAHAACRRIVQLRHQLYADTYNKTQLSRAITFTLYLVGVLQYKSVSFRVLAQWTYIPVYLYCSRTEHVRTVNCKAYSSTQISIIIRLKDTIYPNRKHWYIRTRKGSSNAIYTLCT